MGPEGGCATHSTLVTMRSLVLSLASLSTSCNNNNELKLARLLHHNKLPESYLMGLTWSLGSSLSTARDFWVEGCFKNSTTINTTTNSITTTIKIPISTGLCLGTFCSHKKPVWEETPVN